MCSKSLVYCKKYIFNKFPLDLGKYIFVFGSICLVNKFASLVFSLRTLYYMIQHFTIMIRQIYISSYGERLFTMYAIKYIYICTLYVTREDNLIDASIEFNKVFLWFTSIFFRNSTSVCCVSIFFFFRFLFIFICVCVCMYSTIYMDVWSRQIVLLGEKLVQHGRIEWNRNVTHVFTPEEIAVPWVTFLGKNLEEIKKKKRVRWTRKKEAKKNK